MDEDMKQSILIVDDAETDIDTLVETLGDLYDIAVALDGPSALQLAALQPPDLILLDILMPDMDGFEVCRQLKGDPTTAEIPVIFLTALTETEDKILGFTLGAVDYITKPFDILEVKARVGTHLSLKEALARLERQNLELLAAAKLREDVEHITHHDLKGPLSAIISLPPLLKLGGNLTEAQREWIEIIEQSGYKMLNIVNLSLSLLQMEHGNYELSPTVVDLLSVLEKVVTELRALRQNKQLSVELRLSGASVQYGDRFPVLGEELLCHSLFSNLIKNALEHSPAGGTVTIALAANDRAAASIRNLGETAPEIRDRFFEKYATFGKTGGTGLGTYSARLMARTMGGEVELEAGRPGETTVVVQLPR
jgi:two-component system, sensor histidine kinase and response regulator